MEDDSEEVLDAAQQLMQLSNDDAGSSNVVATGNDKNDKKVRIKVHDHDGSGEEEVDQKRCQIEASIWLKIEEIFGKDDEEEEECGSIRRPKKRRFRSLESIYMKTKPIANGRFSGNGGGGRGVLTGLWN